MQFRRFSEKMASECVYRDEVLGDIIFCKRKGTRRISIRVHPVRGVRVTIPWLAPFSAALAFYKLKRDWVIRTVEKQRSRCKDVPKADPQMIENMRARAKAELPGRLAELAQRYGFVYNRVTIKNNSTNWGSCSTKGNINLNLNIVRLPAHLRDYILLHELSHLTHNNHGPAFHQLQERLCADNLVRLCEEGDPDARAFAAVAVRTRSNYPVSSACSKAMKAFLLPR